MKDRQSKLFRWALWWGLGIMVACLAVMVFDSLATMGENSSDAFDQPMWGALYTIIYRFGIWPMVIFIGIIAPVYEELIFRLWGNGKNWTGYTSVVLMALFSTNTAWWVALIVLAAGIAVMTVYRADRTRRLFALMLFSSLVFALVHIGNYTPGENILMFAVAVLHKFGMGLIASYLVINHNILWSMGLHILNNGILALLLGVGFNEVANETTVVETESYRITMQPVLTKSQDRSDYLCGWLNDSVFYDITSPDFAAELFISWGDHGANPLAFKSNEIYYPKVEMKVEMLGGSKEYSAVIHAMEKEGWIALDTVGDTVHIHNTYNPLEKMGSL